MRKSISFYLLPVLLTVLCLSSCSETGQKTEPTTLVKINHVCASPEEAQAKAATVVYVERGLAKVTMKDFRTEPTLKRSIF